MSIHEKLLMEPELFDMLKNFQIWILTSSIPRMYNRNNLDKFIQINYAFKACVLSIPTIWRI